MKQVLLGLIFVFGSIQGFAQDLSCEVVVDAQQTGQTQLTIFKTLQNSLQEFLNQQKWSDRNLERSQRISCNMFITVHKYNANNFEASLQVQSARPVFGSSMNTPVFNYKDSRLNFTYDENQPLRFNPNSYENNLVSMISFYAYVILGLDADTFAPSAGTAFFDLADQIAGIAEQGGGSGWGSSSSNSRSELNRQLRSAVYRDFHEAIYWYHRQGLDRMSEDLVLGKQNIVETISLLKEVDRVRPNSYLVRSFFDAKANELADILSDGPTVDLGETLSILNSLAPTYSGLWQNIR